ncbi:hypothetical protein CPB83DRAFT_898934 [Crepidotus variabilis]|uniref:Fungal-type protein kinase domain-containing protein n=1 Tax=Crepidotus variabilis TaxID=179855 RepID=A0A9P6E683_9AGAR|nr:hypothetical protein CPB83DRAFT_898934 [Crepidotus variabilis]
MSNSNSPLVKFAVSGQEAHDFVLPHDSCEITTTEFLSKMGFNKAESYLLSEGPISMDNAEAFKNLANDISLACYSRSDNPDNRILFSITEHGPPPGHPTGTLCKPDLLASASTPSSTPVCWPHLVAVFKFKSAIKTSKKEENQAASYALHLLEARPGRHSVIGLYITRQGIGFLIVDPQGIFRPKVNMWHTGKGDALLLLEAVISRLYAPHASMVDSTIQRNINSNSSCTWNITLTVPMESLSSNDSSRLLTFECKDYSHQYANFPIGRRSNVFGGVRRFEEFDIVDHIHGDGHIPGVARFVHKEMIEVLSIDNTHRDHHHHHHKYRTFQQDYGIPFLNVKTPREALLRIYDLLEITRFIWKKRKVLHRDISTGNVLIQQDAPTTTIAPPDGPIYSSFLLDNSCSPQLTGTLLIDFDCTNIGTPVFMARAMLKHGPLLTKFLFFPGMPAATEDDQRIHPSRILRLPAGLADESFISPARWSEATVWTHELRHDAESIFILLLYWAVLVQPEVDARSENSVLTPSLIQSSLWNDLTSDQLLSKKQLFNFILDYDTFNNNILHPAYSPL